MNLPNWMHEIGYSYANNFVKSALLILFLLLLRWLTLRLLSRNNRIEADAKLRWAITLRNAALLVGLSGLIVLWSDQLQSLALSMVAVAVASVIATKELIACLCGSILRTFSNSYGPGDFVQIGPYRGQVSDVNMLATTIMEMGPGGFVHQYSGRAVSIPNSLLLSESVIREDYTGEFVAHSMIVPVPNTIHISVSERVLLEAAQEFCGQYVAQARKHMKQIQRKHLVDTPRVEITCSVQPFDELKYKLVLRVTIPITERQRIEQAILHRFMHEAYPLPSTSSEAFQPNL